MGQNAPHNTQCLKESAFLFPEQKASTARCLHARHN
jgi:hypothetical protein